MLILGPASVPPSSRVASGKARVLADVPIGLAFGIPTRHGGLRDVVVVKRETAAGVRLREELHDRRTQRVNQICRNDISREGDSIGAVRELGAGLVDNLLFAGAGINGLGEVTLAFQIGGRAALCGGGRGGLNEVFVIIEEEQLVLFDGAADVAAQIVVTILLPRQRGAAGHAVIGPAIGIQVFIADIIEGHGMDGIRARLSDDVDHVAASISILRLEVIGQNGDLLDGFGAGRYCSLGVATLIDDAAAIQVYLSHARGLAVNPEIGVAGGRILAAVEGDAVIGGGDGVGSRHHLQQRHPVSPRQRGIVHRAGCDGVHAGGGILDQQIGLGGNGDRLHRALADFHSYLAQRDLLVCADLDVIHSPFAEARGLNGERVRAYRDRREGKYAFIVRRGGESSLSGFLHELERGVGKFGAAGVDYFAGNGPKSGLAGCGRESQQGRRRERETDFAYMAKRMWKHG